MSEKHDKVESVKQEYSEASLRVLHELCLERDGRKEGTKSSVKQDILQRIWSKFVNTTHEFQEEMKKQPGKYADDFSILDTAFVDGTIYQISDILRKLKHCGFFS